MREPAGRYRILFVCTCLNPERTSTRTRTYMQSLVGVHIYSLLDHERYSFKLYHENWHGPYSIDSAEEFDIVLMTGLQKDFDRMRQLSYHFQQRGALVAAGGNFCSLFPDFAKQFFNVVLVGGVECVSSFLCDFERGSVKPVYRSPQNHIGNYAVDFSILRKSGIRLPMHYMEASRGCNFQCDFCIVPTEGTPHATYALENVAKSIDSAIENCSRFSLNACFPSVYFIDNNFSNNLPYLRSVCAYLGNTPKVKAWGALVTSNILHNRELVAAMAKSKCRVLFAGIESFDIDFLNAHNKKQNVPGSKHLFDDIRFAQNLGIIIYYPYMFDPRISSVADMKGQIEMLLANHYLTFPLFFTTVSPLLGTRLFWDSARRGELLPHLRLRDLDGQTLCYRNTVDSCQEYSEFFSGLYSNKGPHINRSRYMAKMFHGMRNLGTYDPLSLLLFYQGSRTYFTMGNRQSRNAKRTFIGGQDILDPQYRQYPKNISSTDKQVYYDPILITDAHGAHSSWLQPYNL